MLTCPRCNGEGGGMGFVTRESGCSVEFIACCVCRGEKRVSAEVAAGFERGMRIRDARLRRDESLREAAKRIGLTPVELGDMERGRTVPTPEVLAAFGLERDSQ